MIRTENFRNKLDGHELAHAPLPTEMPWNFISSKTRKLRQGELQLDIDLMHDSLAVTKTYVVYPGRSIVREWTTFRNAGSVPIAVSDPEFLDLAG
ncbi:MAG: hypothetical protein HY508_06520 [Acidobacteria bacterium]|nr:hypothetical protein [Acidobacteriota bacterium]